MGFIVLLLLIGALIVLLPQWAYSKGWGYRPSGVIGLVILIVIVLVLLKVISFWNVEIETEDGETEIKIERRGNGGNRYSY